MTHQRELERLLDAFLGEGHDELADRVIDAALDQVAHTPQRRAFGLPRRFLVMPMQTRVAAAAVIGVIAIGGAFYLTRPGPSTPIGPGTVLTATPSPSPVATPAPTPTPTSAAIPTATPKPTARPNPGPMGIGRQVQTATGLTDGRVLIAGGYDYTDTALASAVLYDPATGKFSPTGSLATGRGLDAATVLSDGRVLIVGGGPLLALQPGNELASAEIYDPKTGTFSSTGSMVTPREAFTATLLADGRVLVTGGTDSASNPFATAEIYDPKTGTFSPTGSMKTARSFHTATLLADGRVLVVGGSQAGWTCTNPCIASAEIYDPKTGRFTATGSLAVGRTNQTATLLADGRALVTGGMDGDGAELSSAEIFNPRTGTFSTAGPMTDTRMYHTATPLADGRVLVVGGGGDYSANNFLVTADLFDPKTGTFSRTGSMAVARTYQAATLLADGRVLVTGGEGTTGPLGSAEIYDPRTGTFSPAG